jgi:hypothetical protein
MPVECAINVVFGILFLAFFYFSQIGNRNLFLLSCLGRLVFLLPNLSIFRVLCINCYIKIYQFIFNRFMQNFPLNENA